MVKLTHPHASFGEITGSSIWPAKAGACGVAVGGRVGRGSGGLSMAAPGWVYQCRGRWRKYLHRLGLDGVGKPPPQCPNLELGCPRNDEHPLPDQRGRGYLLRPS
jgi:hypothetical protein